MVVGEPSGSTVLINNLDAGNPLHVQNSDSSSSVWIPFKLLKTENYRIWNGAMKLALQARNKFGFVDGSCLKDSYASSDVLSAYKELLLYQQLMKLMQFLMGLADYYQSVRSALLTWDPFPDVKDAYTIVSSKESYRGIPESSGVTESKMNATSFATKSFKNNRSNFNYSTNKWSQQPACNTPSSLTADQMRKLLNLITDTPSRNIHTNMASRGTFFNGNVWFNIKLSRYYCANSSLVVKTITMGWIIDFRANQHLTVSTVGMYNVVDISSPKFTMGHPNGTLATISHVRNLKISKNVILYYVLVVPVYCVSLLYVNKLIKDSKMFVGFDEDKCYIQDLKREITLGTGSESRGLYLFDMDNNKSLDLLLLFTVDLSLSVMICSKIPTKYGSMKTITGLKSIFNALKYLKERSTYWGLM
ncbi:ribonuclease H-like domain-containing protein [Tanacetum coccineum]